MPLGTKRSKAEVKKKLRDKKVNKPIAKPERSPRKTTPKRQQKIDNTSTANSSPRIKWMKLRYSERCDETLKKATELSVRDIRSSRKLAKHAEKLFRWEYCEEGSEEGDEQWVHFSPQMSHELENKHCEALSNPLAKTPTIDGWVTDFWTMTQQQPQSGATRRIQRSYIQLSLSQQTPQSQN